MPINKYDPKQRSLSPEEEKSLKELEEGSDGCWILFVRILTLIVVIPLLLAAGYCFNATFVLSGIGYGFLAICFIILEAITEGREIKTPK